jgi:predicted AlkP superfamily phosphohydrolase/phosphomutase
MAYFDDLNWRSAGTVGHESLYLSENDTGPDDSVHSINGIFLYHHPGSSSEKDLGTISTEDFAPTLLRMFGIEIPSDIKGVPIPLSAQDGGK